MKLENEMEELYNFDMEQGNIAGVDEAGLSLIHI